MADKDEKKPEEKKEEKPAPKDNLVVTKHTVKVGGREIKYTVTAGTMVLKEETADREKEAEGEKPRAQVFYVAYTKDGNGSRAKRPLTFSFNGGPGSSSVWLHLGVLGPRRVVMQDDGNLPKPPYELTDNEYSLLDETDLVFIDPMNTGYSRPVEGVKPKEWHGFKKDIQSVGDFLTWQGWRWVTFDLIDLKHAGHWGGANDGVATGELRLDCPLLLDGSRNATKGTIYFTGMTWIYP